MQYFPLFLDLKGKPVLVVGGGEVASRKVDSLVRAGAQVTIVSPTIEAYLKRLVDQQECYWIQNFYSQDMMDKRYVQVWATTDNPDLNHQVHADAKALGLLVNVVDDQPYCDFITPSMINRGRIQVAISSGGASPVLVRNIREKLETQLSQNLSILADFSSSKRNHIKQVMPDVDSRRKFWERFFSHPGVESATSRQALEESYQQVLTTTNSEPPTVTWLEYGDDVELLSMKAMRLMQQAELVLHEQACPFGFIDLVRRDAEREAFTSEGELAEKLAFAREQGLRIVVFVSPQNAKYRLLRGQDLFLKLATL
ncbi:precorrin-2 dehydrogenase/sirohydrochlorin ferrochelatase family protein [Vibrio sp. LaRot3]|uniref:precorrin-2 dehydrogenase/sirohydrochlorin ferrochelatase family protein n=1 Tax=Vibrio sp. LaRot3 TaxID=2998829 RepID=UPI0022CDF127|nr:NAD(P)-dependent oxidoreductase [Vibrio sp. LaRot3]MDA0147507.1 siroheme synthase [Vibrio sp. LaRot3]